MSRYGEPHSSSNLLRLRVDVHQIFDRKPRFAVVPKESGFVAHIFKATNEVAEAVQLYHNVPLQSLEGVRREFLLARMAWTLFPHLEMFLSAGKRRRISRVGNDGIRVEEELDGNKCRQIIIQSRSRSVSPKKRPSRDVNLGAPADGGEEDDEPAEESDGEWHRSRKRKRQSSISYISSLASVWTHSSDSEISDSADAVLLADLNT
jgi:hypothetical protein